MPAKGLERPRPSSAGRSHGEPPSSGRGAWSSVEDGPLLSWWLSLVFPILQTGKQRPGLRHPSCGVPAGSVWGRGGVRAHSHWPCAPPAAGGVPRARTLPKVGTSCGQGSRDGPPVPQQGAGAPWAGRCRDERAGAVVPPAPGPRPAVATLDGSVRSEPCPSVFQDKHHDAAHEIIETIR